jgi:plastocyanin
MLMLLLSSGLVSAALVATHDVQVGARGLSFTPNITTAAIGDIVTFHFFPGKHNVAQGSFSNPCSSLPGGFYSGFIVPNSGEANEVFTVTINDTNPIWYYCTEHMHCQLGMAGVINPP